jgi:hypothetical protein
VGEGLWGGVGMVDREGHFTSFGIRNYVRDLQEEQIDGDSIRVDSKGK